MSSSITQFLRQFTVLAAALAVALGFALVATAWTGPTAPPPGNNANYPVHLGADNQVKLGGLGVTNLVADQLCFAGDCRTSWDTAAASPVLHVRHQVAAGASPGSGTAGTWFTRPLNTVVLNQITGASLASNRITLPAGTYELQAYISSGCGTAASYVDQIRFRNITDSTTAALGLVGYLARGGSATGDAGGNPSYIPYSRFTISATKVFELQHHSTYALVFGCASAGGEVGIFADVLIKKV
jgi:hypothetical protein